MKFKQFSQQQIIFSNMLTNMLKNKTKSKIKHETIYQSDTSRSKTTLLRLQDPPFKVKETQILSAKRDHQPFLPPIYKTQNLIQPKTKAKFSVMDYFKQRETHRMSIIKLKKPAFQKQNSHQKQNMRARALTDERETLREIEKSKIYHNFVSKKKNKKVNRMSNILEKVLSQDIEPWSIENSKISRCGPQPKESTSNRKYKWGDYAWQKYVLSDFNPTIDHK